MNYGQIVFAPRSSPGTPTSGPTAWNGCQIEWDWYYSLNLNAPYGNQYGGFGTNATLGPLQQTVCSLNMAGSSFACSGNDCTITLSLTFTSDATGVTFDVWAHNTMNPQVLFSPDQNLTTWGVTSGTFTGSMADSGKGNSIGSLAIDLYTDDIPHKVLFVRQETTLDFTTVTSCTADLGGVILTKSTTPGEVSVSAAYFYVQAAATALPGGRIINCYVGQVNVAHLISPFTIWDATPTILAPAPIELDVNSIRVFSIQGYGFGRSFTLTPQSPLRILSITGASKNFFTLAIDNTSSPGAYTVTIRSVGNGTGGFVHGPDSKDSSTFQVFVRPLAFQLYEGLPASRTPLGAGGNLTINGDNPVLNFAATLNGVNTTSGPFVWRVTATYNDHYPSLSSYFCTPINQFKTPRQYTRTYTNTNGCQIGPTPCYYTALSLGGDLRFEWQKVGDSTWTAGPGNVHVKGVHGQPTSSQLFSFIDSNLSGAILENPWFLKYLPGAESGGGFQFDLNGETLWGCPSGYGIYQIDPPDSSNWNEFSVMYSWMLNVYAGQQKSSSQGNDALVFTQKQRDEGAAAGVDDPDFSVGQCHFTSTVGDQEQDVAGLRFPLFHANWIKAYNGANPYYVSFKNGQWDYPQNPLNTNGDNYVFKVCSQIP